MEHHHFHWLEKLQVQIMTIVGLLAVYFLAWPAVRPDDPLAPMTFLPLGGYGSAAGFAIVFCLLVAVCAAATVAVRPVGGLLSATLAAGAVSLRSPQIRALLWARQGDVGNLYAQLMAEALMLAVLATVASLIVFVVRRTAAAINPNWLWKNPMTEPADPQREEASDSPAAKVETSSPDADATLWARIRSAVHAAGQQASRVAGRREGARLMVGRCAACVLVAAIIATVMLVAVMQSSDRGQIIFALLVSFTVGLFVAHQIFPQPHALVAWVLPMIIAVGFYAMAWAGVRPDGPGDWARVNVLFRALPVDWLTAGGGGALLGFWISQRVHEYRHVHHGHEHGE